MNIFITGEKGFIAQNLPSSLAKYGSSVISLSNMKMKGKEVCVHSNAEDQWVDALAKNKVDLIIHNAAVVGTDVVALDPHESTLSNVTGTHIICRAAKKIEIPVCYIGTTVIYNTPLYQDTYITEMSDKKPRTLYGIQKLASENIVTSYCQKWLIMRPLFAYGGVGDMNSLVAKTFYSFLKNKKDQIDMFLDPLKYKDYMHVEDFCDAVSIACHGQSWNEDYNVAAETPCPTGKIIEMMSEVANFDLEKCLKWYPRTDYLGNHRLASKKFRREFKWQPSFSIREGIEEAWYSIKAGKSDYNPLKYLEEAQQKNIDLTEFY